MSYPMAAVRNKGGVVRLNHYDSNHDGGSGAIDAAGERITPVRHRDNQWSYWSLRHGNLGGQTPAYLIAKAAKAFTSFTNERLGCWARRADTDEWTDFTTQTVGATDITLQHSTPFPAGKIYIAQIPLYPFSRTMRKVAEWRAHPYVSDPPSAEDAIIGYATARSANDGSGRTAPALPFYAFKVSSGGANPKNKCILVSGNHPSETPGRFALEGALTWLLTSGAEQKFLLDWWDFYVYPCINPQGVWAGFWSCNPQIASQHNNTAAGFEDLTAFTAAMSADTAGSIAAGIDYHAYNANVTILGVVYNAADALHVAFRDAYKLHEAAYYLEADTTAGLLTKWFVDTLGATLAVNHENGNVVTRSIANIKNSGAYSLRALTNLHAQGRFTQGPGVGSRDFNGSTDRIDWSNVANLSGQAVTISAWVRLDAYPAAGRTAYILGTHRSGDTAYALAFGLMENGGLTFFRSGTTVLVKDSAASAVATGAWVHVLVTHDGVMTTHSSVHIYRNGTELSYAGQTNGAGEYAGTGRWSLGGRYYDDLRNLDGKIAQVAVWNRVLTASEIANLAAAHAPDLVDGGSSLKFHFRGNTNSLVAAVGGTGTADGTTQLTGVGNGPAIIYS